MSHEISVRENGFAEFAAVGERWHGLGQFMEYGASIEEWQKQAGMDYDVKKAFVRYAVSRDAEAEQYMKDEANVVLFRSDTNMPLGIVSAQYQIVQPREVIEFFREWADAGGVKIESAGVLFGGRRYFATAKLGDAVDVGGGDKVMPYALISTSADGTLATEVRWTTVRVVCNNTLSMALKNNKGFRCTHRSKFNAQTAKADIEQANEQFTAFMESARLMAEIKVGYKQAHDLTCQLLDRKVDEARYSGPLERILGLFTGAGKGSTLETARGTAWGYINAVTDYVDHEGRAKSDEHRIVKSLWGSGDEMKQKALQLLLGA